MGAGTHCCRMAMCGSERCSMLIWLSMVPAIPLMWLSFVMLSECGS